MKKILILTLITTISLCMISILSNQHVIKAFDEFSDATVSEMYGNSSHNTQTFDDNSFEGNEANIYLSKNIYEVGSEIEAIIYLELSDDIFDYQVDEKGFHLLERKKLCEHEIQIKFTHDLEISNPKLTLWMIINETNSLQIDIYGRVINEQLFISQFSFDEAEQFYLDNLKETDINLYYELENDKKGFVDEQVKPEDYESYIPSNQLRANRDTYVMGTLRWQDDAGTWHPVQYNIVELWDKEPIGERRLDVTYTDELGNYSFTFENADQWYEFENGGYDVFVRVLPAGTNTRVYRGNGSSYKVDSAMYQNIPTGHTEYFSFDFTMNDSNGNPDTFGRSIQVAQAAIFAAKYAQNMHGSNIASVSIRYPHTESSTGSFYRRSARTIYIIGANRSNSSVPHSYASWDTVMHEYGHHVQYEFNITDSPGGTHAIGWRMADHYRRHFEGLEPESCNCGRPSNINDVKLYGNRLSWGEAWPTYFGTVAQLYYSSNIGSINTVSDTRYTAYNGVNYDLETPPNRQTEDCEITVQAILFDMFDNSPSESHDDLSLGHLTMWRLTTNSKAKTFNEFKDYFLANHSTKSHFSVFGKILNHHRLSPTQPTATSVTENNPTFSWTWSEQSTYYNNRRFELNFYDINRNYIGKSSQITGNSLTISTTLWNSVKNAYGTSFYVSVKMYEMNTPVTNYESEWRYYSKPSPTALEESINMGGSVRYLERIVTLRPSQYIDYHVTFGVTGNKTIQTFGTKDTYIYVYNSNGNLLYSDDDDGYSLNALVSFRADAGIQYKVRVKFLSSYQSGDIKFSITPTFTTYSKYEDIYTTTTNGLTAYQIAFLNCVNVRLYIPPQARTYTFLTDKDDGVYLDMYLYIIDPRSTDPISTSSDAASTYNDDGGGNLQAKIVKKLEINVPYYIIESTYNPSTQSGRYKFTIS